MSKVGCLSLKCSLTVSQSRFKVKVKHEAPKLSRMSRSWERKAAHEEWQIKNEKVCDRTATLPCRFPPRRESLLFYFSRIITTDKKSTMSVIFIQKQPSLMLWGSVSGLYIPFVARHLYLYLSKSLIYMQNYNVFWRIWI